MTIIKLQDISVISTKVDQDIKTTSSIGSLTLDKNENKKTKLFMTSHSKPKIIQPPQCIPTQCIPTQCIPTPCITKNETVFYKY